MKFQPLRMRKVALPQVSSAEQRAKEEKKLVEDHWNLGRKGRGVLRYLQCGWCQQEWKKRRPRQPVGKQCSSTEKVRTRQEADLEVVEVETWRFGSNQEGQIKNESIIVTVRVKCV